MFNHPKFVPAWLRKELGEVLRRNLRLRVWSRPTRSDNDFALVVDPGYNGFPFVVTDGKIGVIKEATRALRVALDLLPRLEEELDVTVGYNGPASIGGPCPEDPEAEGRYIRALIALGNFLLSGREYLWAVPLRLRQPGVAAGEKMGLWFTPEETDQEFCRNRVVRFRQNLMREGVLAEV